MFFASRSLFFLCNNKTLHSFIGSESVVPCSKWIVVFFFFQYTSIESSVVFLKIMSCFVNIVLIFTVKKFMFLVLLFRYVFKIGICEGGRCRSTYSLIANLVLLSFDIRSSVHIRVSFLFPLYFSNILFYDINLFQTVLSLYFYISYNLSSFKTILHYNTYIYSVPIVFKNG